MAALKLIVVLVTLVYSLYSLVTYASRRRGARGAMRALRESAAVRSLGPAEREALAPFLADPLRPQKSTPLLDEQVRPLHGEWARVGLRVHGTETAHETLGGVDVLLPYDAREHLQPFNRAEVVLTARAAVVVALNGTFDLLGARRRALHPEQGAAAPFLPSPEDATPGAATEAQLRELGAREETAAEVAARTGPGWGWRPLLLLLAGFPLLVAAGHVDAPGPWLAAGLALLLAALAAAWIPRRRPAAGKVRRAEGRLAWISLQSPANAAVVRRQLFLGDRHPVRLPAHWVKRLALPSADPADVEFREVDGTIVRVGRLSLDEEVRRRPPVRWGQHLTLALTGLALGLVGWAFAGPLAAELAHARLLGRTSPAPVEDPAPLLAHPPAPGTLLHVRARVRCQVQPPSDDAPGPIACDPVRWGGEAPVVAAIALDPSAEQLLGDDAIRATPHPLSAMLRQLREQRGEADAEALPEVHVIRGITELVGKVDRLCRGGADAGACARLRAQLVEKVSLVDVDDEPTTWPGLVKLAASRKLVRGEDAGLATRETVAALRAELRGIVQPKVLGAYLEPARSLAAGQRGGLLLRVPPARAIALRAGLARAATAREERARCAEDGDEGCARDAGEEDDASLASSADSSDWIRQWAVYRAAAGADGAQPLELHGVLVAAERNERGEPVLEIDPARTPETALQALARAGAPLLGLALLALHGPLFILNLARARRRLAALAAAAGPVRVRRF
jgi:hypothetical protein